MVKTLEETNSRHNGEIKVVATFEGIKIVVGGVSQSGWLVKKVWQAGVDKISKLDFLPRKVLILGLGGGSCAELVAKAYPMARIVGVDIDPVIVELGKKYLNLGKIKNLKFIRADAAKWILRQKDKFDLVLIDLYKGENFPKKFLTPTFVKQTKRITSRDGIVAFNHLYSSKEKEDAAKLQKVLHREFSSVMTVYPEANVIFLCFK